MALPRSNASLEGELEVSTAAFSHRDALHQRTLQGRSKVGRGLRAQWSLAIAQMSPAAADLYAMDENMNPIPHGMGDISLHG